MPVRLLREGIIDSESVNSLTPEAEVFYRRLMSVVDDYGRFDARPSVLRSRLYPLKIDSVLEADVAKWLDDCCRAGLVRTYEVDGKPYLEFHRLGSPRAKVSKYPAPQEQPCQSESKQPKPAENDQTLQMKADESKRTQTHACAPYSYSGSDSSSGSGSGAPPDLFQTFWEAYPRKENRSDAAVAFAELNPDAELFARIMAAIALQTQKGCLAPQVDRDGKSVIPHAAKWIGKKRWEDVPPKSLVSVNREVAEKRAAEEKQKREQEPPPDPAELRRIKELVSKRVSNKPQE